MYPTSFIFTWPRKIDVFGSWPIPMNTPFTGSSRSDPSFVLLSRRPVTALPSPTISSITTDRTSWILGFFRMRSCMILDARSSSRRWRTYTFVAYFVRKLASSMAVSPPPTTAISTPRKKKPSQVAHAETPRPWYFFSDGMPSHFADAPVAMTTASAVKARSSCQSWKGRRERSTRVTSPISKRVPNRSACFFIFSMSSGPRIPSGNPGKFSTSLVMVSCPPGCTPSNSRGFRFARAA